MWMVITQIVSVGQIFKSVVAVATVPLLVLLSFNPITALLRVAWTGSLVRGSARDLALCI